MTITKQDLKEAFKSLATKEDLKSLATKAELKNLATKEDLKKLATLKDLNELAADIVKVESKVDGLGERIRNVPTREEFPHLWIGF